MTTTAPPAPPILGPEDRIQSVLITDLILDPKNARGHGARDIKAIVASIKQYGWVNPVVARAGTNQVICGHGRIQAALRIGLTQVPVVFKHFATDEDARAYAIADNRTAELSTWDLPNLKDTLTDLEGAGYDIALTGWTPEELDKLLAWDSKTEKDPDAIPVAGGPTIAKLGDLWILGEHRVLCGDATDPEVWGRLMNGRQAACCFTDPPYGVSYQSQSGKFDKIKNDALEHHDLGEFLWKVFRNLVAHTDDEAGFYIWHASSTRTEFASAMTAAGLAEQQYLIWVKPAAVLGHDDYQWAHEPCQPAGTMVEVVVGRRKGRGNPSVVEPRPIETLKEGDTVVSYNPYGSVVRKRGRRITRHGQRQYVGNIHTIHVGARRTRTTAEHQFSVRFDPKATHKSILYLMRRGDRWRVGVVRLFNSRGFGLAVRFADEQAEAAWILSVHDDHLEARVAEQATSCLYGIPTTHWEPDKYAKPEGLRSKAHIEEIYRRVGADFIADGAARLLRGRGLSIDDPLLRKGDRRPFSRKDTRTIRTRNIVPGIMQVPIPTEGDGFDWHTITAAEFAPFDGTVYSMDVEKDRHYVADGIITHNCFYAAKGGRRPKFYGDRAQPTVWRFSPISPQGIVATVGRGLTLLAGPDTLHLTTDAPKTKKARTLRIPEDRPIMIEIGNSPNGSCWEVSRDHKAEHPTQKPTELAARALRNSTQYGDIVLDAFLGSGSTLMGAELLGRTCYATELEPKYVDVAIRRWEQFTGKKAERA